MRKFAKNSNLNQQLKWSFYGTSLTHDVLNNTVKEV